VREFDLRVNPCATLSIRPFPLPRGFWRNESRSRLTLHDLRDQATSGTAALSVDRLDDPDAVNVLEFRVL
jgi:hypothetical protein